MVWSDGQSVCGSHCFMGLTQVIYAYLSDNSAVDSQTKKTIYYEESVSTSNIVAKSKSLNENFNFRSPYNTSK